MLKRLVGFCLRCLAASVEAVNINRVWIEESKVHKRRRWYGWGLILIGNLVLACRQVPVGVLFTGPWIRWERTLKQALNDETIPAGRVLICDQLPGVPLADWLIEVGESKGTRLKVLEIAMNSLREFHRVEIDDGCGGWVQLSHGDATLNNLLYDVENRSVQWIDFDLRHRFSVPAPQRHADDLRAFLFSAVRHLPEAEIPRFLTSMRQQYEAAAVWECLSDQVASRWFQFDVFHRAQIRRSRNTQAPRQKLDSKWACLAQLIVAQND